MSDQTTPAEPEKVSRERYNGPVLLEGLTMAPPAAKTRTDLKPFTDVLKRSWEAFQNGDTASAAEVTILQASQTLVKSRFQQAAEQIGCGVSFVFHSWDSPEGQAASLTADQVRMQIQARPRRSRNTDTATATEAPTAEAPEASVAAPAAAAPKNFGKGKR